MARAATTSDVFNALAEPRRREILMLLAEAEKPVGEIVLAHRLFRLRQEHQDLPAARLRQCVEDIAGCRGPCHSKNIFLYRNICQAAKSSYFLRSRDYGPIGPPQGIKGLGNAVVQDRFPAKPH